MSISGFGGGRSAVDFLQLLRPRSPVLEPWLEPTPFIGRADLADLRPLGTEGTIYRLDFQAGERAVFKPRGVQRLLRAQFIPPERAHLREVGAYIVSELTGLRIVPTTILARLQLGDDEWPLGALQAWVDGEVGDLERDALAPMAALDYLIANTDRHRGNWLVDQAGQLWAIDHAASFPIMPYGPRDAFRGEGRSASENRLAELPWEGEKLPASVMEGIRRADPERVWRLLLELRLESEAAGGTRERLQFLAKTGRIPIFARTFRQQLWRAMRRISLMGGSRV